MSNHSQFTKGEFSSALWYCAFWKSGGFKKCGMKLDFLKKLSVLARTYKSGGLSDKLPKRTMYI